VAARGVTEVASRASPIKGDVWEVASGTPARGMGHDARVQALARQVAEDHATSLTEAMALAKRLGIKVERTPTATEEWALSLL
jgi:predicted outer membrane protein